MKTNQWMRIVTCGLAVLLSTVTAQAAMLWQPAMTVAGETDVSNNGSLVVAYNVGDTSGGSILINGVPFSNSSFTGAGLTGALIADYNGFGSASAPFSSLPGANYRQMLSTGSYTGNPQLTPFVLTLNGLTVGHAYEFQWWANDSRSGRGAYEYTTTATDGTSVVVAHNVDGFGGGRGQFAIGTFVATSGSEVISFSGNIVGQINGYQLRDISVPEPATIMLLGIGALLVLRRRHC